MKPDHSQEEQPKPVLTGEELLAMVPEPTSSNTERIAFIERTQRFIDDHAGQLGRFFWGVEVADAGPQIELGFLPVDELRAGITAQ